MTTWLCCKRPKPPTERLLSFLPTVKKKVCISCPLVKHSTQPQSLCSSGSDSPRRENRPQPQLLNDHHRPHCFLSSDHPSKLLFSPSSPPSTLPLLPCLFPPLFPSFPKSSQLGWIYSGRRVAGRSAVCSLGGQRHLTGSWSGLADY